MKIAAFSIADYCEATEGMPHDVERLYFRMLMKMFSREGGLPDDDRENARIFGYDVRAYRRLKTALLQWPDAIYLEAGEIRNARVESDLAEIKARKKMAAENGKIGGRSKGLTRNFAPTSNELRPDFGPTSGELPPNLGEKSDRIAHTTNSKNNHLAEASPSPSPSPSPKEIPKPASVEQDAASGDLAGLNGSAALMIADVIGWTHNRDEGHARRWLSSQIAAYGARATKDAWAKLKTDIAEGEIIARPLQTWCKIAQRLKEQPALGPAAAKPAKKSMLQIIAEREAARERPISPIRQMVRAAAEREMSHGR